MDAIKFEGSQKLKNLAERLRLNSKLIDGHRISDPENQRVSQEAERLKNLTAGQPENIKSGKAAAVLICLFEGKGGDIRVILTKRSSNLSSHSGEVALPGGKVEDGDANYAETALREAKEEIGLDPALVNVVTCLEPFVTKLGVTVVPVIGIMQNKTEFNPVANAAEVEAIFDAPLEMFLKDEKRREADLEWMGQKYLLHFFDHEEAENNQKFVIWALTAGILIRAASLVYQRPPAFEERRPFFWSKNKSGL